MEKDMLTLVSDVIYAADQFAESHLSATPRCTQRERELALIKSIQALRSHRQSLPPTNAAVAA